MWSECGPASVFFHTLIAFAIFIFCVAKFLSGRYARKLAPSEKKVKEADARVLRANAYLRRLDDEAACLEDRISQLKEEISVRLN